MVWRFHSISWCVAESYRNGDQICAFVAAEGLYVYILIAPVKLSAQSRYADLEHVENENKGGSCWVITQVHL